MNRALLCLCWPLLLGPCSLPILAQDNKAALDNKVKNSSAPAQQIPVMNGAAGPCSVLLTVTDMDSKPIYAADVKVHITYGFAGIRKLDLEAGTNSDGKLKFTGIPARVHDPPLEFHVTKADLAGFATIDPSSECEAKRTITVMKKKADEDEK